MITKMILVIAAGLLVGAPASAFIPAKVVKNDPLVKGYVLMGRNVVVLPEMLVAGDCMDFYNSNGDVVLEEYVGNGYLAADISKLPEGAYNLVVSRNGRIVASQMTPFIGGSE